LETHFLLGVLMGPDYFGTAPLQDDQMVMLRWGLQLQLGWSGVVGCQVMVIFHWDMPCQRRLMDGLWPILDA
jgi:hypothetical protein